MEKDVTPNVAKNGALLGILVPILVALFIGMIFFIITPDSDGVLVNVLSSLLTELSFIVIVFLLSRQSGSNFFAMTKANIKPKAKHISTAICISVLCVLLFLPIITLWENLLSSIGYKVQSELGYTLDSAGWIIYSFLAVALLPAICEETLFRGVVLNGTKNHGARFCILYSAICFSLMHLNIQQLPYTFVLGLISGLFFYYTRSLWCSIVFHFVNNAFVLLLMCVPSLQNVLFGWFLAIPLWAEILIALALVGVAYFIIRFVFQRLKKSTTDTSIAPTPAPEPVPVDKKMYIPIIVGAVIIIIFSISRFGAL